MSVHGQFVDGVDLAGIGPADLNDFLQRLTVAIIERNNDRSGADTLVGSGLTGAIDRDLFGKEIHYRSYRCVLALVQHPGTCGFRFGDAAGVRNRGRFSLQCEIAIERLLNREHTHTHLQRQGVANHIVRRYWRTVLPFAEVGVCLRFQQRLGKVASWLRNRDDARASRPGDAIEGYFLGSHIHIHKTALQNLQQLGSGSRIALILGDNESVGLLVGFQSAPVHPGVIAQPLGAEHGEVMEESAGGDAIVLNHLGEAPFASLPGQRVVPTALLWVESEFARQFRFLNLNRCGELGARRFAEQVDTAVVVAIGQRWREVIEDRVSDHALLAFGREALGDVRAQTGKSLLDDRVLVWIQRIDKRRHHEPGAVAAHLVHIKHSLWVLAVVQIHKQARFRLRHHEPVTIIVVAGVWVVEERQFGIVVLGAANAIVPIVNQVDAIRIVARHQQHDGFFQHAQ